MGKFDFKIDPAFVRKLERMQNFDEIAEKMLNEAVPILEAHVKEEVCKHRRTGDLCESVKKTKAKKNQYGWFVTVRPTGKDKNGVRNMEKLAHLEYGTQNQPPVPVLTKALNDARGKVVDKMQDVFNEVIEK